MVTLQNNHKNSCGCKEQLAAETGTGWHVIKAQVMHAGGHGKRSSVKLAKTCNKKWKNCK
jgi:succinyl-CoA synthetase beta subunit